MTGTPNQIEFAEQIRPRVDAEFARVASAFHVVANRQVEQDRRDTLAVIEILNEKRSEVMAKDDAGYFISDWQELNGKVRRLIGLDPRYRVLKARREQRLGRPA